MAKHLADRIIETFLLAGESSNKAFSARDALKTQLEEGVHVEMEHTTEPMFSEKIALDHLAEHKRYYTALSLMEQILEHDRLDEFLDWAETGLGIKPTLRRLPASVKKKLGWRK